MLDKSPQDAEEDGDKKDSPLTSANKKLIHMCHIFQNNISQEIEEISTAFEQCQIESMDGTSPKNDGSMVASRSLVFESPVDEIVEASMEAPVALARSPLEVAKPKVAPRKRKQDTKDDTKEDDTKTKAPRKSRQSRKNTKDEPTKLKQTKGKKNKQDTGGSQVQPKRKVKDEVEKKMHSVFGLELIVQLFTLICFIFISFTSIFCLGVSISPQYIPK